MKRFNKSFIFTILCLFIVVACLYGCKNRMTFQTPMHSETISQLDNFNNSILSSRGKSRTIDVTLTGAPITTIRKTDSKEDKFKRVALADLAGAAKGFDDSKYVPNLGPKSTLVVKGAMTLIYAALFSADAFYDNQNEEDEENTKSTDVLSAPIKNLRNPRILLSANNTLNTDLVATKTELLSNNVALPSTYMPLMEVGARHNILIEKIIADDIGEIDESCEYLDDVEYELVTSDEFISLYEEQIDYLSQNTFETHSAYYPLNNTTVVDEVMNLFVEAFTEYPDNVEDVHTIVNNYIATIEEFNELNEDEKHMLYTTFCVALVSSDYWYNHYNQ